MHDVLDWKALDQRDVIGDKPPVATPPDALRAHDRGRRARSLTEYLEERRAERFGPHVRGVVAKPLVLKGDVRRAAGRFAAKTAESQLPGICDPAFLERLSERLADELRVVATLRNAANIDESFDRRRAQQRDEVGRWERPMTDGKQASDRLEHDSQFA